MRFLPLFLAFFLAAAAPGPVAHAGKKESCEHDYAEIHETFLREMDSAVEKARKKVGLDTEIKHVGNTRAEWRNSDGDEIGYLTYVIDKNKWMQVDYMSVRKDERDKGVGSALMASVLKKHPEIKAIEVEVLDADNEKALQKAIKEGLPCVEALMETPAYKIRARFGFTEIFYHDKCRDGAFSVRRPK